jgi:nitrogen regulatory protein P-II 1
MKKIEAIIRPHKKEELLKALVESEALSGESALGITILETVGFGRQKGHSDVYRGSHKELGLVPKRMLIMYVSDDQVNAVVGLITKIARTGKPGDGKIAVLPVENLIRVRTGEEGEPAL